MFEQTFVNSQGRTRKPWTVGASLAIQAIAVVAALIAPLMHIASLEFPARDLPVFVMLKPVAPAPEPVRPATVARPAPKQFRSPLAAPTRVPAHVDMTPEAPELPALLWPGTSGSFSGSTAIPGAVNLATTPAPSKPVTPRAEPPSRAIRVGTGVEAANLIYGPKPLYPQLAKAARVQGVVKLEAIVAVDGTIRNLRVISGPALLVNAAVEAVQRWKYKPTLLNGSPVEVITEIDVSFTLN